MDKKYAFLKEITDIPGIPGQEGLVKKYLAEKFLTVTPDVSYDRLGSVMARLEGDKDGPVILAAGHMDEVGFIVTSISKDGFLKFAGMGGWVPTVLLAQQVSIIGKFGTVHGVIGSKPPHLMSAEERKVIVEVDKMFIDIGATSADEVKEMGISLGDMIVPYIEFKALGKDQKHLLAKAWDNRIGCALALEILQNLKKEGHPNIFVAAATTQEEVGCRGAQTIGYMASPHISFSFDVSIANDVLGATDKEGMEFGKGPQLHLFDAGTIGNRALREFVMEVAEELKIPYQITVLKGGGTDASRFQMIKEGSAALSIGIPSRYIHSHTSMIHYDDYINAIKLMTEVIKRLDSKKVQQILES